MGDGERAIVPSVLSESERHEFVRYVYGADLTFDVVAAREGSFVRSGVVSYRLFVVL